MKLVIRGRNFSVESLTDAQREKIETKVQKLEKYFNGEPNIELVISKEKNNEKVEITLRGNKSVFRAESAGEVLEVCLEKAVNKLLSQIHKFKGRLEKRYKNHDSIKFKELQPIQEEDKEIDEVVFAKKKVIEPKPITPEDAVMEMELVGHNFYVFVDEATGNINVVYKRNDGKYGLIETVSK